jgi:hypothetical protein
MKLFTGKNEYAFRRELEYAYFNLPSSVGMFFYIIPSLLAD